MFKVTNILVPTDFSEYSLFALDEATHLAGQFGANIHLLHVVEDDVAETFSDYPFGTQTVREHMTQRAHMKLGEIQHRYEKFAIFAHIRYGAAAREIVGCADAMGIDIIAIATHGRSGLARLFLGSVAEEVVRTAHCPVMTVREPRGKPVHESRRKAHATRQP